MTFSALDSALTGPLFATPEMRDCFSDAARLRAMLAAEESLARAEAEFGIAPPALGDVLSTIDPAQLDPIAIGNATALAGVPTIPFVKSVQALLQPEMERHFHKGATTQDILDTALVIQAREAFALLCTDLRAILPALAGMADRHRDTPCVGRTYGQHAAPIAFGYRVAVWLAALTDVAEALPSTRQAMLTASLSGPVGTLASLGKHGPAVLEAYSRELGLAAPSIAWHARRDRVAATGCWLARLIGAAGKMATDIVQLCATDVAELAEPYVPGRGGSSAMPHKRNPVSCTVILAAHAAAPSLAATVLTAIAAAQERPPGLWHAEWHALPALFGLASGAMRELRALAEGLEVDGAQMARNLDTTHGLLYADAAAARLTSSLGREAAHTLLEHAAAETRRSRRPLLDVLSALPELSNSTVDLGPAFDAAPAVAACGPWIDRAIAESQRVSATL